MHLDAVHLEDSPSLDTHFDCCFVPWQDQIKHDWKAVQVYMRKMSTHESEKYWADLDSCSWQATQPDPIDPLAF